MKRKLTLLLAAVMAASSLPMSAYAANFRDINDVPWAGAEKIINEAVDRGLLSGFEDNTFRARENVTYCQAMQMAYTVLMKTGAGTPLDAVTAFAHYGIMNTYGIPAWAQTAVAYGLEKEIITTQDLLKFMTGGVQNAATREDVAMIFGNALSSNYSGEASTASASQFRDYWSISTHAMAQVDLLKRLGIVSGDDYNQFNPKKNISRTEMAVMLNKTYEVLTQGTGNDATITDINRNGDYYYIDVEMADGTKEGFNASAADVKVYAGNTDDELSLSRLSKGDKISIIHNNWQLQAIRLLDAVTDQEKFDITGYITKATTNVITLENENTGETDDYSLAGNCIIYLDEKQVNAKEMKDAIEERSDEFAYARLMISSETETVGREEGTTGHRGKEEVIKVEELHISFGKEYTATGEVTDMDEVRIGFKALGTGEEKLVTFDEGCDFYIGDSKSTVSKLIDLADSGTVYVKAYINQKQKAEKIVLSEESFDTKTNEAASLITYEIASFTESKLVVLHSGEKVNYSFGSTNPVKNISFYTWDDDEDEWNSTSEKNAREYYLDADDETYCRLEFNSGGKISAIYLSEVKSAWRKSGEQTERKGTVASLEGNTLKFEGVSTAYTLMNKYNVDYKIDEDSDDVQAYTGFITNSDGEEVEVRYPLIVNGAVTSSLTVFKKAAQSEGVELYAEIVADGDNRVLAIDARFVSVEGTLVEYDRDEKEITIETEEGETLKLQAQNNPKLTDEDEDTFTLDHVGSTSYIGSGILVECNSSGVVNKITILDSAYGIGFGRVKGIATVDEDGNLEVEGEDEAYGWVSRKDIIIHNNSMPNGDTLAGLKKLLGDDALEVYVDASLNERQYVDEITVTVKAAEGILDEYDDDDHVVRIITDNGEKFSFNVINKPDFDVDGVEDLDDLAELEADDDVEVELTFNDDGKVSGISD